MSCHRGVNSLSQEVSKQELDTPGGVLNEV